MSIQSQVDNFVPYAEDICGFSRERDPFKISNRRFLRQSSRVETFKNWPQQLNQSAKELAEAGFIYKNYSDTVKCISCKLKLGGWQPQDDPWEEHAKNNPSCEYLIHHKGQAYIDEIQGKSQQILDEPIQPEVNLNAPTGICKVCSVETSNVMFIPCGHLVTCTNCAPSVKKCFYCSHIVNKHLKVYL
ncbi:hypothetical protein DMENIID0001_139230 [Sergentomyia squamirostris]